MYKVLCIWVFISHLLPLPPWYLILILTRSCVVILDAPFLVIVCFSEIILFHGLQSVNLPCPLLALKANMVLQPMQFLNPISAILVQHQRTKYIEFDIHCPLPKATLVYCDNVSAIYLSGNSIEHQRTKYIDELDIHFLCERSILFISGRGLLLSIYLPRTFLVFCSMSFATILASMLPHVDWGVDVLINMYLYYYLNYSLRVIM